MGREPGCFGRTNRQGLWLGRSRFSLVSCPLAHAREMKPRKARSSGRRSSNESYMVRTASSTYLTTAVAFGYEHIRTRFMALSLAASSLPRGASLDTELVRPGVGAGSLFPPVQVPPSIRRWTNLCMRISPHPPKGRKPQKAKRNSSGPPHRRKGARPAESREKVGRHPWQAIN